MDFLIFCTAVPREKVKDLQGERCFMPLFFIEDYISLYFAAHPQKFQNEDAFHRSNVIIVQ